ncbi:MAG: hypothetical protein QNJ46_03360 [Leptolyngbyaceae cyanobacterium MO_188.B28]|nr:hypothetical protein [Leptolyngbyaceae cyanobacterium MO_188.B28]
MNSQLKTYQDLELIPDSDLEPQTTRSSFISRLDTLWKSLTGNYRGTGKRTLPPVTHRTHYLSVIIHRLTAVDPWDQPFEHDCNFCVWLNINDALGGVAGIEGDGDPPHWQSSRITIKNPPPNYQAPIVISLIRTDDSSDAKSIDIAETQRIELAYNLETEMVMGSGVIGRQGRPMFYVSPFNPDKPFNRIGVWFSVRHQSE